MSVVDITFPGNISQVDSAAALRAVPSNSIYDTAIYLVVDLGFFGFDAGSTADDNGVSVLSPNDLTPLQAGRWLISGGSVFDAGLRADLASTVVGKGIDLIGRARKRLSTDQIYYVRTDGSDSNIGTTNTSGGAFLTIQKAIDTVYSTLDFNGHVVTIQVADGTYTAPLSIHGLATGATANQPFRLLGNEATPASVVISVTGSNALTMENGAYLLIAGVTMQTTIDGAAWSVASNSMLEHRNCRFGNVATDVIISQHHASVRALGPTTIAGNAVTFLHATKRSIIDFASQTLTYVSNPTFSTYLFGLNDASVNLDSATIVGTATGRILVHDGAILNISSLTGNPLGGTAYEVEDGGYIANPDLMTARTLYVNPAGNDANDGFANTATRAFATTQAAINTLAKMPYDPKGFAAGAGWVIKLADGTYGETVKLYNVPYFDVTLRGNTVTPGNVIISGTSDGITSIGTRTNWNLDSFRINAAAGLGLRVEQNSAVSFQNIVWGVCTSGHIQTLSGGVVNVTGSYAIAAAAPFHIIARLDSVIDIPAVTVTITGTPAFSGAFALVQQASAVRINGATFTGAATGTRYSIATNGVIDTNGGGASYLPGGSAGATATGGQYA